MSEKLNRPEAPPTEEKPGRPEVRPDAEKQASGAVKPTKPFRYGVGMFGTSIPVNMFKSFAAIYYVDQLGLSMKHYSFVLFIYTFLDVIDNPVYGFLSDRTRTRWGRRRPWLVIGTPLLVLSFVMFFNVPGFISSDQGRLFIYMLLLYLLTGTLDSLINANYGALFPELFRSDKERAKTNAIRQACQLVAMVISIALTPMIMSAIGYRLTSLIYGVVALAVILYCTFGCHESMDYAAAEKPNLWKSIVDLVRNGRFWIYGIVGAFYSAATALLLQAVSFYVKYSLRLAGGQTTLLLASVFAVALIGILVWTMISRKVDVMKIWRLGFLIMGLAFLPLLFTQSLAQSIPFVALVGFGYGACLITMDCIGAKIIDDDYQKHHIRREGIMTSLIGMLNRLNGLYSSLAFFVVSERFGFVNGDNPGPSPDTASRVLMCVFPFLAMAVAYIISHFLHFTEADNAVSDSERG